MAKTVKKKVNPRQQQSQEIFQFCAEKMLTTEKNISGPKTKANSLKIKPEFTALQGNKKTK